MYTASKAYKAAMSKMIRSRAYISAGVGIINQEAQADCAFAGDYAAWSDRKLPLTNRTVDGEYATLEENFMRCDGSQIFLPEYDQYIRTGITTKDVMGTIRIEFGNTYNIKGLTVEFPDAYPVKFKIRSNSATRTYENANRKFETTDTFEDTTYIDIIPVEMRGGNQRLRINSIKMGIGLTYTDDDVDKTDITEFISFISGELPSLDVSLSVLDYSDNYNVDNANSFINFLATKQKITISFGMTLEDGTVEWIPAATAYLSGWDSKKGSMSFKAKDIFAFMEDKYTGGNYIHTRTAYSDAVAVLTDAGFQDGDYEIDDCLKDVILTNPLPEAAHKECLQLLCNACRCILYQDEVGKIVIRANFANILEPGDVAVTSTGESAWSHTGNITKGADVVYADLAEDFMAADGSQMFLPEDGVYSADTGYVSGAVADSNGLFSTNPTLTLDLGAGYVFYGIHINFDGNPPQAMTIHTYLNGVTVQDVTCVGLEKENYIDQEFAKFDVMTFEFTKAEPNNRILVNKISFGDLSDYNLLQKHMTSDPVGYRETRTKDLYVRIYEFYNNENNEPTYDMEKEVYYKQVINPTGENKYCENQLISTEAHAKLVAEWLGNYYANDVSYNVDYRGEPRLHAADIIFMESEVLNNLQVDVEKAKLAYNGAFSGSLELRRAQKINL